MKAGMFGKLRLNCILCLLLGILLLTACAKEDVRTKGGESEVGTPASTVATQAQDSRSQAAEPEVTLGEESALLHKADHSGKYCYEKLNDVEKLWYADMYAIMDGMHTNVTLSLKGNTEIGEEGIDRIFQCVMNDYPELFFVKGYTYTVYTHGQKISKISFSGTYTMDAAERAERQALIDAEVETALAGISPKASDYDKIKYVYEYVIKNTNYNMDAPDNQNICSVFIGRESVCQGYAKATQYLLERLGIPTTLVVGMVYGTESHAWNLVLADGAYYYVDTTWGDASYQMEENAESAGVQLPSINYDYLCVTTERLLSTHHIENVVELPLCESMDNNYYVREGAYFASYDEAVLRAFFEKNTENGKTEVTIQCADKAVFDLFLQELITNQKIFRFLNSPNGTVAYIEDADKFSLTFWLVNE